MATTNLATSYAAIVKQEKQEDGTLLVYGKATDDAIDSDNQICDAGWLSKAMPEWFKSGGNIREQHSNIAAGVAKELDSKSDGHYISALVVDPTSIKKVEAGVLKGFSIGIRGARVQRDDKALGGRIIDGQIVEVSLVDRPANPNAKLMLAKSDGLEVIQVEEMIETEEVIHESTIVEETPVVEDTAKPELIDAELPTEEVTEELAPEASQDIPTEVVEEKADAVAVAKAIVGDVVKFDKGLYEAARIALAQLIIVESNEMVEGSDERYSLANLLGAIQCLEAWYEGEEAEGETTGESEMETVELADSADKSIDTILPETTIERLPTVGDEQIFEDEESSSKSAQTDNVFDAIIEKAVKSATDLIRSEVELLKSAKEADTEVINKLESELAAAKSKAASGGPKRTAIKPTIASGVNEFINKAAEYRAKASATSDPILAKGWKEMATDFESKAAELLTK